MRFLKTLIPAALYAATSVFSPQTAQADAIVLRNGTTIENCIAEESGGSYNVRVNGTQIRIPKSSVVEFIDEPEPTPTPQPTPQPSLEQRVEVPQPVARPITPQPAATPAPTPVQRESYRTMSFPDQSAQLDAINQEFIDSWDFNLDREIARVMLNPEVPRVWDTNWEHYAKWQRSSYLDIIDAARGAFHQHRNPTSGAPGLQTETITVPGNITGQDTLRIRYLSGSSPDFNQQHWGDDEDIVYITGGTSIGTLKIDPGTIVLFASHQNDDGDGAMTTEMINHLMSMYNPDGRWEDNVALRDSLWSSPYNTRRGSLFSDLFLARGTKDEPIILCSDSSNPTHFDYHLITMRQGILDNSIQVDSSVFATMSNNSLISRTLFNNHLESGMGGPSWIIANYFGNTFAESIGAEATGTDPETNDLRIVYNVFRNQQGTGPGLGRGRSLILKNNYFGSIGLDIGFGDHNLSEPYQDVIIQNNWIESPPAGSTWKVLNNTPSGSPPLNITNNYWNTTNSTIIENRIWNRNGGTTIYQPFLTSGDSDLDGLTDAQEATLGTDPNNMDTDGDLLIDGWEVNTYRTNPLNQHSDNDRIIDGIEVFNGTDPLQGVSSASSGWMIMMKAPEGTKYHASCEIPN